MPQEEDIGIIPEGSAGELAAEDGVAHGVARGDTLAVGKAHIELIVIVQAHIAADAAIIHLAEGSAERDAAADQKRALGRLAQKVHRLAHDLAARALRGRLQAHGVQEIELQQAEAPVPDRRLQALADILPRLGIVEVPDPEAVPVDAAANGLALLVAQEPVGVLRRHLGAVFAGERRKPESRRHAERANAVGNALDAVRELLAVNAQPVADVRLEAVVDLEHIKVHGRFRHGVEILQDLLLGDILIEIIPARVAGDGLCRRRRDVLLGKPEIEHVMLRAPELRHLEGGKGLRDDAAGAVARKLDAVLAREKADRREARTLAERAEELILRAAADVCVGKAVQLAGAGGIVFKVIVAVGAQHEALLRGPGRLQQTCHDTQCGELLAVRPGLVAVQKERIRIAEVKRQLHLGAHELHRLMRREHQLQDAVLFIQGRGERRRLHAEHAALLRSGERERLHLRAASVSNFTSHHGSLLLQRA